jgi:hypothetical protein
MRMKRPIANSRAAVKRILSIQEASLIGRNIASLTLGYPQKALDEFEN